MIILQTLRLTLIGFTCLMFGACASVGSGALTGQSDNVVSEDAQLFGDYLAGRYAETLFDMSARSEYFSSAYALSEENTELGREALESAILVGDMDHARRLARKIQRHDKSEPLSRAVLGVEAFTKGRHARAAAYFDETSGDLMLNLMVGLIKGWNKVALGDNEAARLIFRDLSGGTYFDAIGALQIAKLDGPKGLYASSDSSLTFVETRQISAIETALTKARIDIATDKTDRALEDLKAFSDENGPFETGPIRQYITTLEAGEAIDAKLTPQQEASRALTEPAYGFFARNGAYRASELFLRMALELDPEHDKAALWLASLVDDSERSDEALERYEAIDADSPYIVSAQLARANVFFDREEDEKAIDILEAIRDSRPSFVTREALGRARLIRENYADALPIYDELVKSLSEEELKQDIQPLYFRGICYERTQQFDRAVIDFKRVLELDPENADALNYLGYTWVDRGENLEEAFEMIRKAVKLEPNSGAIVDSLGWAHYKLGQYHEAKANLEKAVELSPSSATIIDHLGDVYWKLGRFREAGYQWERALDFDPTEEERLQIRTKLLRGLDAVSETDAKSDSEPVSDHILP